MFSLNTTYGTGGNPSAPQDTAATAIVDSGAVVRDDGKVEVAPRRRKESGPSPLLEDPEDRWIGILTLPAPVPGAVPLM